MNRLQRAANKYNDLVAADAYTPATTFLCQFEPMSFSKIDGVAVRKRQISIAPDVTLPARSCVTIGGENYICSHPAPDFWRGSVIRQTVILQGSDGLAKFTTIEGELNNAAGVQAHAAKVFAKYMPDQVDSSKYPPQYQIFMAGSESAPADSLIQFGSEWFLVKQSYESTSGMRIALSNLLESPVFETILAGSRTYDPLTDSWSGSTTSMKVMRVKWSEHYEYLTADSTKYQVGDLQVFMLQAGMPTLKVGDTLTLSDGLWKVLSLRTEGTTWSIHARRG